MLVIPVETILIKLHTSHACLSLGGFLDTMVNVIGKSFAKTLSFTNVPSRSFFGPTVIAVARHVQIFHKCLCAIIILVFGLLPVLCLVGGLLAHPTMLMLLEVISQ